MKKGIVAVIAILVVILIIGGIVFINKTTTNNTSNEEFVFTTSGQEVKLGANILDINLPEATNVYEAESCAFDGIEKTYTYENFEITTCPKETSEDILTIYLLNEGVSTKEGIKIGDSIETMKQVYGENFEQADISYIYTKGNTTLTFIVDNDVITSIEYRLITE